MEFEYGMNCGNDTDDKVLLLRNKIHISVKSMNYKKYRCCQNQWVIVLPQSET